MTTPRSGQGSRDVSNNDSFIEEVTEEVRRDRLYSLFRRYGWIAAAVVVLLVGGAAFNEFRKARASASAQALGDGLIAALEADDVAEREATLESLTADGDAAALVELIRVERALEDGDRAGAAATLDALAGQQGLSPIYRDYAILAGVIASGADRDAAERIAALDPLTAPGAPFRLIAKEQQALIHAETGDTETAQAILRDIIADTDVTAGLRLRASQLIVALGGELEAT